MTDHINPLHAQLHQKVQEVRSGKAFSDPKSWMNKIHSLYTKTNEHILTMVFDVSFITPLLMAGFVDVSGLNLLWLLLTTPFLGMLALMIVLSSHKGGHQEMVESKLIQALRRHPSLRDDIKLLSDHLHHPDILRSWWMDLNSTLSSIILEDKKAMDPEPQTLQELLAQSSDQVIVVNTDELEDTCVKENSAVSNAARAIKI